MNVLFILISNGIGGAEKRYGNLFNYLSVHGVHSYRLATTKRLVDLLSACSVSLPTADSLLLKNIWSLCHYNVGHLSSLWNRFACSPTANKWDYMRQLNQYFEREGKPDIIHCVRSATLLLDRLGHYKTVASLFSSGQTTQRARLVRDLKKADAYDVLHPMVAEKFEAFGLSREKMHVAPCSFVDYSTIPDPTGVTKRNEVVFSSRLVEGKGVEDMLAAAKLLGDSGCSVTIMGDGSLAEKVRSEIDADGPRNVRLLGFVPNPPRIMVEAKVFCSLQRGSNYPSQSLIEAMACGCAVVATDVGDTRMLVDEKVGILVRAGRPREIADAIATLLADPERCERCGRAARKRVLETMRVERYASFLEELYEEVGTRHEAQQAAYERDPR